MTCCGCLFCLSPGQPDLEQLRLPLVLRTGGAQGGAVVLLVGRPGRQHTAVLSGGRRLEGGLLEACGELGVPMDSLLVRTDPLGVLPLAWLRSVRWGGGGGISGRFTAADGGGCGGDRGWWRCVEPVALPCADGLEHVFPAGLLRRCLLPPPSPRRLRSDDPSSSATPSANGRATRAPKRRRTAPPPRPARAPVAGGGFHTGLPGALWTPEALLDYAERHRLDEARLPLLLEVVDLHPRSYRDDLLCRWRHPAGGEVELWMSQALVTICRSYHDEWRRVRRGIALASSNVEWDRFEP